MELATVWELLAVVAPLPPDPLLAPPAASTLVTEPEVVFPPSWPRTFAAPVRLTTVPRLVTVVVLVVVPEPVLPMMVLAESMPSP